MTSADLDHTPSKLSGINVLHSTSSTSSMYPCLRFSCNSPASHTNVNFLYTFHLLAHISSKTTFGSCIRAGNVNHLVWNNWCLGSLSRHPDCWRHATFHWLLCPHPETGLANHILRHYVTSELRGLVSKMRWQTRLFGALVNVSWISN